MPHDERRMTSPSAWQPVADREVLLQRALMLKNIRAFFEEHDVLEVETPLLSQYPVTDLHLDSLAARFREQPCYLNTSPEYAMKRLLASWSHPFYQICKAFRDDELGQFHNPEFSMLEWYRPGFDMSQLMQEMEALIRVLFVVHRKDKDKEASFEYISYQQAFISHTKIDPHQATSLQCYQFASSNDVEIPQGLTVDDDVESWLDWLLMQVVQPAFAKQGFTFLYDYPVSQSALASIEKNEEGLPVAKRFELFYGELELANGFFELTDGDEQLRRFQQDNQLRLQAGKAAVGIDERFIAALSHGLPVCSGVAMGLDRLLMVLSGAQKIEQVLCFPWFRA